MLTADVVVAGGGVSGLLIATALAPQCSVVLLEQSESIPQNKYWLTDERAATQNPQFAHCTDRYYKCLDFIAYNGVTARLPGQYCLWDTHKLIQHLQQQLAGFGVRVLTGHRLYSISYDRTGIAIRANTEKIHSRLLVDCMGFGSPLVCAKNTASITGYYIVYGTEVNARRDFAPIALDNVIIDRHPAFFELFPTSNGTAHAAIILPARHYRINRSLKGDLHFILQKSHYSQYVDWHPGSAKSYFGIIPVGRLNRTSLDRILFFGEAGQANPATSATGLTRMLRTHQELARSIVHCLDRDTLRSGQLSSAMPQYMTRMNRLFQEVLFESLLSFNSDDFVRLVEDLQLYPSGVINDLIFAELNFGSARACRAAVGAIVRPNSVLGSNMLKAISRFLSWRRSA
jgi:flavin-dependent dehydrogenase